ncbi:hypothetical protein AAMO2058_000690500 [Amorphochlora amoebiformis]
MGLCDHMLGIQIRHPTSWHVSSILMAVRIFRRLKQAVLGRNTRAFSTTKPVPRMFEMRKYSLKPDLAGKYWTELNNAADVRRRLLPLLLFANPETGGRLHVATHLYGYQDHMERDRKRAAALQDPDWQAFLSKTKQCINHMESSIYVEAKATLEACGLPGAAGFDGAAKAEKPGIYEFRRYELALGYTTVPRFLEYYGEGLPSKLDADPEAELVTLLYSDVGMLNEVYEIWRHADSNSMTRSRIAAREAKQWRLSIGKIAELARSFNTTILKPVEASNWK